MNEMYEVALAMLADYYVWNAGSAKTKMSCEMFVATQMPDESAGIRRRVADELYRLVGRDSLN